MPRVERKVGTGHIPLPFAKEMKENTEKSRIFFKVEPKSIVLENRKSPRTLGSE